MTKGNPMKTAYSESELKWIKKPGNKIMIMMVMVMMMMMMIIIMIMIIINEPLKVIEVHIVKSTCSV